MRLNCEIENLRKNLPQYLRQRGLPLHKNFRCLNPEHRDIHPSMGYNPKTETVHCFACGKTYDLFDLLGLELGTEDFSSELREARRRFGTMEVLRPAVSAVRCKAVTNLSLYREGEGKPDRYFNQRGLSDETVCRYGLRVESGWAVLPLFEKGQCIGLCRRSLSPEENPRYKNTMGKMGLWNADVLCQNSIVFVTEGIFDALSLTELGFAAVALCGAANTAKLTEHLRGLSCRPVLVFAGDADEAGNRMNRILQREAQALGFECRVLSLPGTCHDCNEALLGDRKGLEQACRLAVGEHTEETVQGNEALTKELIACFSKRREEARYRTGLDALDEALGGGLGRGLCVLGAVSGMGKTTLMLQLADTLAAQGKAVLFFTVEMSRVELLGKCLARNQCFSARELLEGQVEDKKAARVISSYWKHTGGRVTIFEPDEPLTPIAMEREVEDFVREHGVTPVVFLDYLQLLAPTHPGATDKQNADRAVASLKQIARRHQTMVFTASSFNRQAYSGNAGLSSFKESGLVEYSADLLLALQYRNAEENQWDWDAKQKAPIRELELLILKNRFGQAGMRVPLDYLPARELFEEPTKKQGNSAKRNRLR